MSKRIIPLRGWLSLHEGDAYANKAHGYIRAAAERGEIPIYRVGGSDKLPRYAVHTDDIDAHMRTVNERYVPVRLVV